jgi:hypothetical protein
VDHVVIPLDSRRPSWQILVDRVVVTGGWTDRSATSVPISLGP